MPFCTTDGKKTWHGRHAREIQLYVGRSRGMEVQRHTTHCASRLSYKRTLSQKLELAKCEGDSLLSFFQYHLFRLDIENNCPSIELGTDGDNMKITRLCCLLQESRCVYFSGSWNLRSKKSIGGGFCCRLPAEGAKRLFSIIVWKNCASGSTGSGFKCA